MIKLKEFLKSNESTIIEEKEGRNYSIALAKMYNYTKDMVYIFMDDYCRGGDFNPLKLEKGSFLGIYSTSEEVFYFESNYRREFCRVDVSDLNCSTLSDLATELVKEVNNKIVEKVENDESRLNVDLNEVRLMEEYGIEDNARRRLLRNSDVNMESYASYSIDRVEDSFDTLLDCIRDKENTIEKEANNYIEENKNKIYSTIVNNKKIKECIESISNDADYIRTKELNSIFANKDLKTVTINYKKDGNEMKFKIETRVFLSDKDDTISSYNIQPLKDRKTFKNTFKDKRGLDYIEPEYIEEITHGKKVLYKKNA